MAERALDLRGRKRLHVTNVGGAGMSAVATLLAEMGHVVSGHDPSEVARKFNGRRVAEFIPKPYSVTSFANKIRSIMAT